ncbi:hypothetical protein RvY_12273-2 [Ramazzottius varieornatus]|uniref:C3H1-type domain-containing protein n=1 Tax=Ramazzottius varieornatus TaxID=947166 RepID=A0A1D1VIX2_RAMVA|nr:hypothetical protein RvY_12273-2 [Ramazzottius varieornatus]
MAFIIPKGSAQRQKWRGASREDPAKTAMSTSANFRFPPPSATTPVLPMIHPTSSPKAAQHTVWRNRPLTSSVLFSPAPFLDHPPPDKAMLTARTEMCVDFFLPRGCRRGKECRRAHHESELMMPAVDPRYKTKFCRRMLDTGFCCFGDACLFIHAEDMARMDAKMQWLQGGAQWSGGAVLEYGRQRSEQGGRSGVQGNVSGNSRNVEVGPKFRHGKTLV